jgi:uncharacterized protein YerC
MSTPIAIVGGLLAGSILTYVILAKDQKAESQKEGTIAERADEIVIYYKLRQDECPGLFDDLATIPKGQPRASRLKVLVLMGFDAGTPMKGNAGQPALAAAPLLPRSQTRNLSVLIKDPKAESREGGTLPDGADEIVIYYKLRQDECPGLFDDLATIPKGQPRASRLKVLALRGFNADRLTGRSTEQITLPGTPRPPASRKHIHPI